MIATRLSKISPD